MGRAAGLRARFPACTALKIRSHGGSCPIPQMIPLGGSGRPFDLGLLLVPNSTSENSFCSLILGVGRSATRCNLRQRTLGRDGMALRRAILVVLLGALSALAIRPDSGEARGMSSMLYKRKRDKQTDKERTNMRPIIGVVSQVGRRLWLEFARQTTAHIFLVTGDRCSRFCRACRTFLATAYMCRRGILHPRATPTSRPPTSSSWKLREPV